MSTATPQPAGPSTAPRADQRAMAPSSKDAVDARKEEIGGHVENHGHSTAAWTGVAIVTFGALLAAIAMLFPLPWLVIVGLALMPLGGLVGLVIGRGEGKAAPGEKKVVR